MKNFCATITVGYGITVTANPDNLTEDEIGEVLDALVAFDDVPLQDNLDNMLANASDWLRGECDMTPERIEKYKRLCIDCQVVAREALRHD